MRAFKFITGHVIYNPAYTYKFQLKTTKETYGNQLYIGAQDTLKQLKKFVK